MVEAIVPSLHASMSYKYKGNNMKGILSNYNTPVSLINNYWMGFLRYSELSSSREVLSAEPKA